MKFKKYGFVGKIKFAFFYVFILILFLYLSTYNIIYIVFNINKRNHIKLYSD